MPDLYIHWQNQYQGVFWSISGLAWGEQQPFLVFGCLFKANILFLALENALFLGGAAIQHPNLLWHWANA